MPVLRTYDVSDIEKIAKIQEEAIEKRKNNTKAEYTPEDIILVRTTDYLPEDKVMKPFKDTPNIVKDQQNFLCNQFLDEDRKTLESLETYYPYYRSTIHNTENGIVSSHMYGNFENRNFIILEPLKNQLDKSNIRNFAGQDTFIQGDMKLSDEAVIIINSAKYQELLSSNPNLINYNICLYNGMSKEAKEKYMEEHQNSLGSETNDEEAITSKIIMDMGYTPEIIGSHYIIESNTSNKIVELNKKLAAERNVSSNEKHQYSKEYQDDLEARREITKKCDRMLADFIIKANNLEIPEQEIINSEGEVRNSTSYILKELIGMDNLKESVAMFNETIEKMKDKNRFPTPEEFVKSPDLDIYNEYVLQQQQANKMQ